MKIALIGATGSVGSRVLAEALGRGHSVTALSRQASRLEPRDRMQASNTDINDPDALAKALSEHDVVVSSVRFLDFDVQMLLQAIKASGVSRLLMVGGAGSLLLPDGSKLADSPTFPAVAKAEADAGSRTLEALRAESALNWTFISPGAVFVPGERTGQFRLGGDRLLVDVDGKSRLSQEDFSVALVNELESAAHPRQRFSVAY